ncbi:MAG TPA: TerC family protein [Bacillota bacterium]
MIAIIMSILSITLIDLVLSGDNAAVIGLAIKDLPHEERKSAALWGAGGAIVLRVFFTVLATLLLKIPYLNAIGGVILLWITWNLLNSHDDENQDDHGKTVTKFWKAVGTIILADLSMAFDNIMGVAGAAHGEIYLVIFGLALSIPILVLGASWLATLMEKFPIIIYLGGAVLVHTSLAMIFHDKALYLFHYLNEFTIQIISWLAALSVLAIGVFKIGLFTKSNQQLASTKDNTNEN